MDKKTRLSAINRDERAIVLPLRLPTARALESLKNAILEAISSGDSTVIDAVCREKLLPLLDAQTELAFLKGGRRAELAAEKVVNESVSEFAPVKFSLSDNSDSQARGTIDYLRKISGIDPSKAKTHFRKHNAGAVGDLADAICTEVKQAVKTLTENGVHVRGGKAEIARILNANGVQVLNTTALAETLFRTQSQQAYAAGRWTSAHDSDFGDEIWGFEYVTVGDDRVREGHRVLEGVRLPKDDPFWQKYFPPNGWNCRCTTLEIWRDDPEAVISFGITGRDPRTRTADAMNVPKEFRGNVGVLAVGKPKKEESKQKLESKPKEKPAFSFPKKHEVLKELPVSLGGSTGAKLCEDENGYKFVKKKGGGSAKVSKEHLASECSADAFYRAMGINVPEFQSYEENGEVVKLSRYMKEMKSFDSWWNSASDLQKKEMREKLIPGFAADVLLGNWDVLGMSGDNIMIAPDGSPWRIDNGGSLSFRAQGAKKDKASWEDGWPDDIWTMRGKNPDGSDFQFKNPWTEKVFGDISTCSILEKIASQDWSKAIEKLNDEDKKVVEKRLLEIRQLAERAIPFRDDGLLETHVETIISHSYRLSKEGFREAVPEKIELDSNGRPKDFGFFRSNVKQQFSSAAIPSIVPDDSSLWPGIIRDAVKTINYHISQGNPSNSYNWSKVNLAISLKSNLQSLLVQYPGNSEVQYCLGWVEKIEKKSKTKKTNVLLPMFNDSVQLPAYVPPVSVPVSAASPVQYCSLTDWIHQSMTKEEAQFIMDWQASQAGNSYDDDACKFKIASLMSKGITSQQDAENAGYYVGIKNHTGAPKKHYDAFLKAFDFFIKKPKKPKEQQEQEKQKKIAMDAFAKYQAAIQLILENSEFQGNDKLSRTVVLMRTEDKSIFGGKVPKIGRISHNPGINESHSIFQTVHVGGGVLTMVRVPYNRISGMYFLERTPGRNDSCFYGDNENEFNADTHGLDIFCVHDSEVNSGISASQFRPIFDNFENLSKNP